MDQAICFRRQEKLRLLSDDIVDLQCSLRIRKIGDIRKDFTSVCFSRTFEIFQRAERQQCHHLIIRRAAVRLTRPTKDLNIFETVLGPARLHQRNMLLQVIVGIELRLGAGRIHHRDQYHRCLPSRRLGLLVAFVGYVAHGRTEFIVSSS